MIRIVLFLFLLLSAAPCVQAVVEIQLAGDKEPAFIRSVYLREGIVFLPLRELLPPLHLSGSWDAAKHLFRIDSAAGEILLAPGSRKIRSGKRSLPLKQAPRFLNGELCVPEEVVTTQLPRLLGIEISYVNQEVAPPPAERLPAAEDGIGLTIPAPLQQIIIDPGHGGDDPGAISPDGVKEKDLTLAIALRLEKILKMEGLAPILLTRDGDYALSLRQRAEKIREAADDNLLISLHASAWRSSETRGCTLYLLPLRDEAGGKEEVSLLLAQSLGSSLKLSKVTDCSIERASLFPLSSTPAPAVLLELGYLTNPEELALLGSNDGQERIARALAIGVKTYAETRQRRRIDVPVTQ